MMPRRFHLIWLGWLFLRLSATAFAASAPDWMKTAVAAPTTVTPGDAGAVVLLDDGLLEFSRDGGRTMRLRKAVRVFNGDGSKEAIARVAYLSGSTEVRSFKAWLIRPNGEVVTYAKRDIVDIAVHLSALELYGEAREQLIRIGEDATPGSVLGYESVVTGVSLFNQILWNFRGPLPTERSSVTVSVPPGWTTEARVFNRAELPPVVNGPARTWTMSGLAALPDEPMSPAPAAYAPWLAINAVAPPNSSAARDSMATGSWNALARYFTPRYTAAAQWDAPMKQRSDQLVAGAATLWDRVQRLCHYAQQVHYIMIQLDAANGGSLTPRPASRVFQCNYGDCKDKATLLRALLASQGIESYPVVVFSGGRTPIREIWPSPSQFNHCILAIKVDDSVTGPALLVHPRLGRLLVFDPTDEYTPAGLLAGSRLAGQGLLVAGDEGGLVNLPSSTSDSDRLVRHVTARLDPLGNLQGEIEEQFGGLAASAPRAEHTRLMQADFRKHLERWLGATLPMMRASKIEVRDEFAPARFTLSIAFASTGYGKLMRDELLVFKPFVVSRHESTPLTKKVRTLPIVVKPQAFVEQTEIVLPEGYVVDELPATTTLTTEFGSYAAKATSAEGRLVCERSLTLQAAEIPAAGYDKVKGFFEKIQQSEQSPVVLRRVTPRADAGKPKDG